MNASLFISGATLSCMQPAPTYGLVCSVLISMPNSTTGPEQNSQNQQVRVPISSVSCCSVSRSTDPWLSSGPMVGIYTLDCSELLMDQPLEDISVERWLKIGHIYCDILGISTKKKHLTDKMSPDPKIKAV